jgi:hypothetical protein
VSAHTPGPWSSVGNRIIAGAVYGPTVAFANSTDDASLIAAAPDLLNALERVRDYFAGALADAPDIDALVEAAIDKATGGDL